MALADVADDAQIHLASPKNGLATRFLARAVGKDVDLIIDNVLTSVRVNGWGEGGNIEAKKLGIVTSNGDFNADITSTRVTFFEHGIRQINVRNGSLKSNIETDRLGNVIVTGGDAQLTVNIVADALALRNKPGVNTVKVTGGDLVDSQFNLQDGSVLNNLLVLARGGLGGNLVGTTTINGNLKQGRFSDPGADFDLMGTLMRRLTASCASDAVSVLAGGDLDGDTSEGDVDILTFDPKARIVCR